MDVCPHASSGVASVRQETVSEELLNYRRPTFDVLPAYLRVLQEGYVVCGDSQSAFAKPEWFNSEMFRRGQQFGKNYSFGIMFAELLSLFILFSLRQGLEPLIYTGKSDTPFTSFKRYLSTVIRTRSWYETDIWQENTEGHDNLKKVRDMHKSVRRRMTTSTPEEVAKKITLVKDNEATQLWTTLYDEIQEDFQSSCPVLCDRMKSSKEVFISQASMACTQFGFVGLILLFPRRFGIHRASKKDLEGFAHFWRTIGYLLGIEDRFNLCDGNLDVVQQRCHDMIAFLVKPSFRSISPDWIHMSRCLAEGISYYVYTTTFEVLLVYLCTVLNIATHRLKAALTLWQKYIYCYTLFLFWCLMRLPVMWALHNWLIKLAIKRAQNKSTERLRDLELKVYNYQLKQNTS